LHNNLNILFIFISCHVLITITGSKKHIPRKITITGGGEKGGECGWKRNWYYMLMLMDYCFFISIDEMSSGGMMGGGYFE
jgi:hypothetical protein